MYSRFGLLIDGEWRDAVGKQTRNVFSPVNEDIIGTVPNAQEQDIQAALRAAQLGFDIWSKTPAWERAKVLRKASELIRQRQAESAHIMSVETGKPIGESMGEINAAADQFEWYSEEAKRLYGQIIPARNQDEQLQVVYHPVGPCLALSAWNFPALLPARKIAAALAAGCSVVARPASEAPGSCFVIAQALMDAGLPKNVLTVMTGQPDPMVNQHISSDIIKKVSLTGSVPVGKKILHQAADGIKKISMELGGHAPVIVHHDVDPVKTAHKLAATKFRNCGQVCISPSRFYIHSSIYEKFVDAFVEFTNGLVLGDGLVDGVTTGPMIREQAVNGALSLIEDAIEKGAELLTGGHRAKQFNKGHFLQPTVLANVPDNARIMREEPFAPVAPITAFDNFDEVIKKANSTEFGLAAYLFTHDSALAQKTAMALEAGMVGINETLLATAEAPFGGIKQSGFGREGGTLGIMDYVVPKYIRHKLITKEVE